MSLNSAKMCRVSTRILEKENLNQLRKENKNYLLSQGTGPSLNNFRTQNILAFIKTISSPKKFKLKMSLRN